MTESKELANSLLNDWERTALSFIKKGSRIIELITKIRQLDYDNEMVDCAFAWLEHSDKTVDEIIHIIKEQNSD